MLTTLANLLFTAQVGAERLGTLFHDHFDTVIMINVLEHVASAYEVVSSDTVQ